MKKFLFTLIAIASILNLHAQKKKALFVIVDGVAYDVIQKLELQNLNRIAGKNGMGPTVVGGEKGGKTQSPTISAVGYNTVLTGVWANKHNVWDNDIDSPNYKYPTIFRVFKDQFPDRKIAIFSSWLDNRTKLAGDGLPQTGKLTFDHKFDGLELDTINFPHDKEKKYMQRIDQKVVEVAAKTIRDTAPDLSWVYLEYTDDMGHRHGDSEIYYQSVKDADKMMGQLYDAIQYREKNFREDWLIIITTDHGRDAKTGHGHGGQSDRERSGWIVTNARKLNKRFTEGKSELVDIFPTIAHHLKLDLPENVKAELEGKSIIGK
jgi:predicted AlkP superfamily pyrophosphatase or phosphodiesterase